jgi:hypothetical protein
VKPYDQQPQESAKAYEAFKVYLDQGPQRSIRATGRKLGKNRVTLEGWSSKWRWVERVKAWEADAAEREKVLRDEAMKADAAKWAERQRGIREREFSLGEKLLARAEQMLEFPLARRTVKDGDKTTVVEPARWNAADAPRMAAIGTELVRRSAGLPTDKLEVTGPDNQPVAQGSVVIFLPDNGRDKRKG